MMPNDKAARQRTESWFDKDRSSRRMDRRGGVVERVVLVLTAFLFTGLGWWIAHLERETSAFERGRADREIELRHEAEINEAHAEKNSEAARANASEEGRLRLEAEKVATDQQTMLDEKVAWQAKVKQVIRQHLERARAAKDEESPTDSIIALRIAGDILQNSPIDDESLIELYDGSRSDLAIEFLGYLFSDMDVDEALELLAQESKQ